MGFSEDGVSGHLGRLDLSLYTVTDVPRLLMRSLMGGGGQEDDDKQSYKAYT